MPRARTLLYRATDTIKARTSLQARRRLLDVRLAVRRVTGGRRGLPELLIIGTMRGGTSSLYKYLSRHPQIVGSLRKETRFFSAYHHEGLAWYRAHFPLRRPGDDRLSFEATPDYMFHPWAAKRAAAVVPHARILVVLRDPVERAISHYHHMRRLGLEPLSIGDALDAEPKRLLGDLERSLAVPDYRPLQWERFSYLARGHYAEQLATWLEHYPRDQMLVIRSEALFTHPAEVLTGIQSWLGVSSWLPAEFRNYSYASGIPAPRHRPGTEVVERLERAYADEPRRLAALLGEEFAWW